jgi:hypothetical protein
MTSSGLRQKALRGRLIVERIAGKDFTTLAHIERMRELCRVSAKARDSSSERPRERTDASSQTPSGPSAMESAKLPQESLRARLSEIGRRRLVNYITSKHQPPRRIRDIEDIDVADVLAIYHAHRETTYSERGTSQTDITEFAGRIGRLNDFFGGRMLAEMNAQTCGQYVKARGRPGGARRDLEDLRAAINHHAREGLHRGLVRVALPAKGRGRDRWLTRSEAAALLWVCWRYREVQTQHRGALKNQKIETEKVKTDKRPLRYIARFILIGLYRHARGRHRVRLSVPRGRPIVCRLGARYLLSTCARPGSHQKTPAPGALARALAGACATLGSNRRHQIAFCRIQRRGRKVGKDGVPKRRPACALVHPIRQGHTPHVTAYGRNLVNAAWRGSVESGRVSWDVRRGVARYLWRPPPRVLARGGGRHHDETNQEHRIWVDRGVELAA